MEHKIALDIAASIAERLFDQCEKIQVAGSLRRNKRDVKDIEICAIPKMIAKKDMFGVSLGEVAALEDYPWDELGKFVKNGSRYKQIELKEGINLDLFLVLSPAQWGVIFAIRTGPAEFSKKIVTQRNKGGLLPSDCEVHDGGVYRDGMLVPMPTEEEFLDFLGIGWVEPHMRANFLIDSITKSMGY